MNEREPAPEIPALDPATGLPAVPEGYFWRVRYEWSPYHDNPAIVVELRRRAPWPLAPTRSRLVASRGLDADGGEQVWIGGSWGWAPATPDEARQIVLHLAALVWRDERHSIAAAHGHRQLRSALDDLAGDYPPKVLS